MFDQQRLEILGRAAEAAPAGGNVAVTTRDLRWLVSLAQSAAPRAPGAESGPHAASAAVDWKTESIEDEV